MVNLKVGDYVRNQQCPEWGAGLVSELRGTLLIVCFEHAGRAREFRMPAPMLEPAPEVAANPPKIASARSASRTGARRASTVKPTRTFARIVADFRAEYPAGFKEERWQETRRAREEAAKKAADLLSLDKWGELVTANSLEDLGKLHRTVVQTGGLLHPVQALRISSIREGGFWWAYRDWAWEPKGKTDAFEVFMKGLEGVGQATWPNATALRGILHPATELFVKPDSLKRTAAALSDEVAYEPKPSFDGYAGLLTFAKRVRERLEKEGLAPRDLWDVSQFFRIAAGGSPTADSPAADSAAAPARTADATTTT